MRYWIKANRAVLYLYEITLLSNSDYVDLLLIVVLYLYEITLLSNVLVLAAGRVLVLYLYEITLLSNGVSVHFN